MPIFDKELPDLEAYKPEREEQPDFDSFWSATLDEARQHPVDARFEPVDALLSTVDVFDVTYRGFGGDEIRGWFVLPRGADAPLPCVVEYIGYGGGRGLPHQWLLHASAGRAHFVMDTRGQRGGDTPDLDPYATTPSYPGFMTMGVESPETYYYRRLMTDAVRAIDAARSHPLVDPARVIVSGGSQGGGLALAAGGLASDVFGVISDVPFLTHYRRAVDVADDGPYPEIKAYLRDRRGRVEETFKTLSYFDGLNFAARCTGSGLISVGLLDNVCPPSTVYAAYHHYAGPKELRVWEYNKHEGGANYQQAEALKFLKGLLA